MILVTNRPNELWECDTIERLTDRDGKSKFILVMIDHYSKWTEAVVL